MNSNVVVQPVTLTSHFWHGSLDNHEETHLVSLDISKIFDLVSHGSSGETGHALIHLSSYHEHQVSVVSEWSPSELEYCLNYILWMLEFHEVQRLRLSSSFYSLPPKQAHYVPRGVILSAIMQTIAIAVYLNITILNSSEIPMIMLHLALRKHRFFQFLWNMIHFPAVALWLICFGFRRLCCSSRFIQ